MVRTAWAVRFAWFGAGGILLAWVLVDELARGLTIAHLLPFLATTAAVVCFVLGMRTNRKMADGPVRREIPSDEQARAERPGWSRLVAGHVAASPSARRTLQEEWFLLRTILAATDDLMSLRDVNSVYLAVNPAFEQFFRRPESEVVGKSVAEVFGEADALARELEDRETLASGERMRFRRQINGPDGLRWFDIVKTPITTADGRAIGILTEARDVTQARLDEVALRTLNERLTLALDSTSVGIWDWNVATGEVWVNAETLRRTGLAHLPGPLRQDLWAEALHPDDKAETTAALDDALEGRTPLYRAEYRSRQIVDGRWQWEWIQSVGKVTHRDEAGRPTRMLGVDIRVSDRKRAEDALASSERVYRALIESTGTGSFILDFQGRILDANPEYVRQSGHRTFEEIRGRSILEWVAPHDLERMTRGLKRIQEIGGIGNLAIDHLDRNHRVTTVEINAALHEASAGPQVLAFCRDVTDRKAEERVVRQAQRLQSLGTLAGGIAHDFNNILTAVLGFSELIKAALDGTMPHQSANRLIEFAQEIVTAANRGRNLVRQIFTFSSVSETSRLPTPLVPVIDEAASLLRASLPATIEIARDIDPAAQTALVLVDPTQIHQVLMNLGTNAAHAMRQRGGRLTIQLRVDQIEADDSRLSKLQLTPGRYVALSVIDTGVGMTTEVRERIFDPFFTTKGVGEGTGLGLSVVHGIIRAHQGAIDVESILDRGTTVRIFLVSLELEPDEAATARVDPDQEFDDLTDSSGFSRRALAESVARPLEVLVIDDEPTIVSMLRVMLENSAWNVTVACSSEQAYFEFYQAPEKFDVILSDVTMPGMSGLELATRIREIRPEIPILLCTGHQDSLSPEMILDAGVQEILVKPIRMNELLSALERSVNRPGAARSAVEAT